MAWQFQLYLLFLISAVVIAVAVGMACWQRRGRTGGKIVTARDVTDRRRAEAELRQLQRAVEQSPASVVITDTAGRIEYVNPHFTQLTGYTVEEALGQNPRILKTDHTPPEVYAEL